MKSIRIRAWSLLIFVAMTLPVQSETWGCVADMLFIVEDHPHEIELVSNVEDQTGSIKKQGLPAIPTYFRIEGLNRVWRWIDDGPAEEYAFSISDGGGYYYEFFDDKQTQPKETYACHDH